jgi:hypothetical protein
MLLTLTRDSFAADWTLGRLAVTYDGQLAFGSDGWHPRNPRGPLDFAFVCEDQDRGLAKSMPLEEIRRRKVAAETAIPVGEYVVRRTWSPKYGRLMMLLEDVPEFAGIRIHAGNDDDDTAGCLLPGLLRDVRAGRVSSSTVACQWLDDRVRECEERGEAVRIAVQRNATAWAAWQARGGGQ